MNMTKVVQTIKEKFDAAHNIPGHPKCGRKHGHTYHVEVDFEAKHDDKTGMGADFHILKEIVRKEIVEPCDHNDLNNIWEKPTAENMAKTFFEDIADEINARDMTYCAVLAVTVWETESCGVMWSLDSYE